MPALDQSILLRIVSSCGAVVDIVGLALLSPIAAGELGASVHNEVNWHAKQLDPTGFERPPDVLRVCV